MFEEIKSAISSQLNQHLLPGLMDFIRIPNLSNAYDKQWKTNGLLQKAADFIVQWTQSQNVQKLTCRKIQHEQQTELIYIEIEGSSPDAETALFYGHYDKQPHFTGWKEGFHPTEPKIFEGHLYGRGSGDDGYAAFAVISIIKVCQLLNIPHPRCTILIEGEEESGSETFPKYIEILKETIQTPSIIVCLDSGANDYKTLWLTTNLRGYIDGVLSVQVLEQGVHSGEAGGVVPSSFRIMRQILDRIEDSKTGKMRDELQVVIPPQRYQEAFEVASQMGSNIVDHFPFHESTQSTTTNYLEAYLNKTWRAQACFIGIEGMPDLSAGNVLRPFTKLAINIRVPPTLNTAEKAPILKQIIEQDPPYNATVKYHITELGNGWNSAEDLLNVASENFYGEKMRCLGEGGSIPLMNEFQKFYPEAQFLVVGVLGPGNNAHGPNENFQIAYLEKLMCSLTYFLSNFEKVN